MHLCTPKVMRYTPQLPHLCSPTARRIAILLTVLSIIAHNSFKDRLGSHSEVFSSFFVGELFQATLSNQSPALPPRIQNLSVVSLMVVSLAWRVLWRKSWKRVAMSARNGSNVAAVCRGAREKEQFNNDVMIASCCSNPNKHRIEY